MRLAVDYDLTPRRNRELDDTRGRGHRGTLIRNRRLERSDQLRTRSPACRRRMGRVITLEEYTHSASL